MNCSCSKPPGGSIECPDDHLAICRKENGECHGSCHPIPKKLNYIERENWLLGVIKGEKRTGLDFISKADREILNSKNYVFVTNGVRVTIRFDFPEMRTGF